MKALVPLPAVDFYEWQAVVQAYSFSKPPLASHPDFRDGVTYLVYYTTRKPPERLKKLSALAEVEAWRDWRTADEHGYNPAMKPWLVGKYLEGHPDLVDVPMLLMDPDVIPTGARPMPMPTPTRWWGTCTDSYTGAAYLRSKGEEVWLQLCSIVGVDPAVAEQFPGVGAQYTFVGQGADFWSTVARQSVEAYRWMTRTADQFTPLNPDGTRGLPVQAWCSEMYIMQLEMIRRGIEPMVSDDMEMVWEDGPAEGWESVGFFHDAGCAEPKVGHFHKQSFQVSPWGRRVPPVDQSLASYRYSRLIAQVAREHPQLIWR